MKTPKRWPATMSVYATRDELRQDRARWKRKNRVKQLKQSLHKYKYGTMLPKLQALRLAYKWMQELKKPQQDAEVIHWYTYLSDLKTIQREIARAVEDAATCLGVAIERQERKEQE